MRYRKRFLFTPVLLLLLAYLFYAAYQEVRERTIEEFNVQQLIMARQASTGLQRFFQHLHHDLTYLATLDDVVDLTAQGRMILNTYIRPDIAEVVAITRMDSSGRIIHTYPLNDSALGQDISYQSHVKTLLATEISVISDVFTAVQGYDAVAYHIPIHRNGQFRGSLALLIDFDILANHYLETIVVGESGYAWMLSAEGIELYCPVTDHVGRPIHETASEFPSILEMADRMLAGRQGIAAYDFDQIKDESTVMLRKQAAYCQVDLGNTFWSIAVATPEDEILATMKGFRNRFFIIAFLFGLTIIFYYNSFLRAWQIVREEEQRKQAEAALRESERKFRNYISFSPVGVFLLSGEGHILDVNEAATALTGYEREELLEMEYLGVIAEGDRSLVMSHFERLIETGQAEFDLTLLKKSGGNTYISTKTVKVGEDRYVVYASDISERFQRELETRKNLEEKEILLREIHHRVKNNLNVIISLLRLQAEEVKDNEPSQHALRESINRVFSMALVHERMYRSEDFTHINMRDYISSLTRELAALYRAGGNVHFDLAIEDIELSINTAIPLGLILNELITNSFKHAFPEGQAGKISINFDRNEAGEYEFIHSDDGIGLPATPDADSGQSLGLRLIKILTEQIQGELELYTEGGATFQIRFPMENDK